MRIKIMGFDNDIEFHEDFVNILEIPDTNQFETEVEYGQTPYTTTPKNYEINIFCSVDFFRISRN